MTAVAGRLAVLDRPMGRTLYYGLALLLGVLYVARLFPLDFLTGHSGFFFDTRTDPTQHITGIWAFVHDQWRFPLLHTALLNAPDGASAAYADIIPLAAIPFKLISGLLPADAHYLGVWILGCYVLQGVAGAYVAAVYRGHTPVALLAGCLFALMMPSLLIRIPHAALHAQFLLIFLLGLYLRWDHRTLAPRCLFLGSLGLLLLAGGIHPYLLAMVFAFYAAVWLAVGVRGELSWVRVVAALLAPLPLLALEFYVLGYFDVASGLPPSETGYIESSMNILSPLLGTQLAPSVFLPSKGLVLDATGMQIDGHNYLGVALLGMLLFMVLRSPRWLLARCRHHWVLVALCVGLTIYALSNRIYLSNLVLLEYPLPGFIEPLTKIFRGSGRFFWPVGYILLMAAIGYFLTRVNPVYRLALLALLAVQYVDMRHHRAYLAEAAGRSPYFSHDRTEWDRRVSQAEKVYLLPNYGCGGSAVDALFLQYFTALHGKPLNTGFLARIVGHCAERTQVLDQPRTPGELFVFGANSPDYPRERIERAMQGHYAQWCRQEPIGTVCQVTGL
ncbi:DUF6311 domain-containing protein [uncultured Pseudomonas sp.]|uniref:DUF6311 domain-containing protein n=1 Tax=uncultured Pseudomonas sp. TaxID=114707 RepID=UPI0025837B8E|nr:DUF6311 domain-containing protein [uncultured Pseudomonas sp.]